MKFVIDGDKYPKGNKGGVLGASTHIEARDELFRWLC